MNRGKIFVLAFFVSLVTAPEAWALCPTFSSFGNGDPANGDQVMSNFNYILTCASFANIGINKAPNYVLDLNSQGYSQGTMAQFDNDYPSGGGIRFASYGTTELWFGEGTFAAPNLSNQDIAMVARGALEFDTGAGHSRPAMYISSASNISIGTMSPLALFDLGGLTVSANSTAVAMRFTELSGAPNSRNWLVGNGAGPNIGDLSFLVSTSSGTSPTGTPVLELSRSAKVGINTANPAQALEVNGEIQVDNLPSGASTNLCVNAGVISSCSSSLRYKENVRDARFGLKEIEAMRPVTFKWRGRREKDIGLIAEEVAKINPLFVSSMNGRIEGVKYSQLTAVVVNAIKELKAANDIQAAEIARLKVKVEALEHRNETPTIVER